MLTDRLGRLARSGIIGRTTGDTPGSDTTYHLIERGRGLAPAVQALVAWGFASLLPSGDDAEPVTFDQTWAVPTPRPSLTRATSGRWTASSSSSRCQGAPLTRTPRPARKPIVTLASSVTTIAFIRHLPVSSPHLHCIFGEPTCERRHRRSSRPERLASLAPVDGRRRTSERRENGSNKPKPLPSIADSCAHNWRGASSLRGAVLRPFRRASSGVRRAARIAGRRADSEQPAMIRATIAGPAAVAFYSSFSPRVWMRSHPGKRRPPRRLRLRVRLLPSVLTRPLGLDVWSRVSMRRSLA